MTQSRRKPRDETLTGLFTRANDALLMPLQDQLRSHGFSIVDWRVLKTLLVEDGMRITDLAERALSRQVAITQSVGRMERSGSVRRRIPSGDHRSRRVYLTERGRSLAQQLATLERQHERVANRVLGGATSRKLKMTLARFVGSIEGRLQSTQLRVGDGADPATVDGFNAARVSLSDLKSQ